MLYNKKPVRIAISDKNPFIFHSIQLILLSDFTYNKIITYPLNVTDLIIQLKETRPDILVTDFGFFSEVDNTTGVKEIQKIHNRLPDIKIIALTSQRNHAILKKVLQIPVNAIVSKRDEKKEITKALQWVLNEKSGIYYSERMKHLEQDKVSGSEKSLLSPTEAEVIRLFAMGYKLTEIARLRKRSVSTVATQKFNAMRKLQLHSNTDLIKYVHSNEFT